MAPRTDDEVGTTPLGVYDARAGKPRFELRVFRGQDVDTHVLPNAGSVTLGRSHDVEVRIDDASVSRRHALLHVGSALLLQDLGSQNGTRVGTTVLVPHRNTTIEPGVPFVVGAISVVVQPIGEAASMAYAAAPEAAGPAAPPSAQSSRAERRTLRDEVAVLERARIVEALAQCGGNQTKAAELLGMPRRTLVLRIAEYNIPRPRK